MNKKILACDFSLTGCAFIYDDNNYKVKYKYFSSLKSDFKNENCCELYKEDTSVNKLDKIIKVFEKLLIDKELFILESPAYSSVNSNNEFKYGYGIMMFLARKHNVPYLLIPPISNKLYFTGNGKATKDDMIKKADDYNNIINIKEISKKHQEDISDCLSLYLLGKDYIKNYDYLVLSGENKHFNNLELNKQQVIAKLYNREDLVKKIIKLRKK